MEIKNNMKEVPFAYYTDNFKKLDPKRAVEKLGVEFDGEYFTVRLFSDTYKVGFPDFSIASKNREAFALREAKAQIFIMRLLLEAEKNLWCGSFKTFREMSWGEVYIQPFTGRCIMRAAFSFGTNIEKFASACEALGAQKLDHADAAYQVEIMPGYFIQILVWEGDDEFSPNSQILYSDNFEQSFSAEDRVVIAEMLITLIRNKMKEL